MRRLHRGTKRGHSQAVMALPAALVKLLHASAEDMARRAEARGDPREAYAHSRDALYYVLAFLACLRKSEAVRLVGDDFSPGVVEGTVHVYVAFSKADQAGVGAVLPIALRSRSGLDLGAALGVHRRRKYSEYRPRSLSPPHP